MESDQEGGEGGGGGGGMNVLHVAVSAAMVYGGEACPPQSPMTRKEVTVGEETFLISSLALALAVAARAATSAVVFSNITVRAD